ncbi:MAG: hypothetical protein KY453_09925, partial [Gemmatimonadetes bacterium]|nr:hypothetical protein [Gemmatimonadota bacterium]
MLALLLAAACGGEPPAADGDDPAAANPLLRPADFQDTAPPNTSLDEQGFAPFGEVAEGMGVVESLHAGYGDGPPRGEDGVYQAMAIARGDAYLDEFPELDRIERAT